MSILKTIIKKGIQANEDAKIELKATAQDRQEQQDAVRAYHKAKKNEKKTLEDLNDSLSFWDLF